MTSLSNKILHKRITNTAAIDNQKITRDFLKFYDSPEVRKTHLFDGRYENIYIDEQQIPELSSLMKEAVFHAENILNTDGLRAGYWFNYMPPGATTTLHTHDDDDELLSAVYYVYVPENSGNLVVYDDSQNSKTDGKAEKIELQSKTNDFIFFKPDIRHEVTKNNSNEYRLSIGINFGLDKP